MNINFDFSINDEVVDVYGRKGRIVNIDTREGYDGGYFTDVTIRWAYAPYEDDYFTVKDGDARLPLVHSIADKVLNDFDLEGAERKEQAIEEYLEYYREQLRFIQEGIQNIKVSLK